MHRRGGPSAAARIAVLGAMALAAVAGAAPPAEPPTFEFLYVVPASGSSSGGHVALRLGGEVYHYQHVVPELIRLKRDPFERFDHLYRVHGNRSIYASRVEIDPESFARAERRFERQLLVQDRHFAVRAALREEGALLAWLDGDRGEAFPISLPATGYFVPDEGGRSADAAAPSGPGLAPLREEIRQGRGGDLVARRIERLARRIDRLRPRTEDPVHPLPEADRFLAMPVGLAVELREALTELVALEAIEAGASLLPERLREVPGAPLSAAEIEVLRELSERQRARLHALFDSPRPDRGMPLLVGAARWLAMRASIERGRLLLIDPFPEDALRLEASAVRRHDPELRRLLLDRERELALLREAFFELRGRRERGLSELELAAARVTELTGALEERRALRIRGGLVPARSARRSDWRLPRIEAEELAQGRAVARQALERHEQALARIAPYDVFRRNCVTELFVTVEQAAPEALAGLARIDGPLDFIPMVASDSVEGRWPVVASEERPSYRAMALARMDTAGDTAAALAERTTLTSALYRRPAEDSAFLLFTDDVFWPRPVFGAANLLYGTGALLAGVTSWPLDGGDLLDAGWRGVVFSVPELGFVNLRKGSFPFVPMDALPPQP